MTNSNIQDVNDARRILNEIKTGKQKLIPLQEFEKITKQKTKKGKF